MGFDYVELSASEMAAMEPWDPSVYDGLNVKTLNLLLPGGVSVWTVPPAIVTAQLQKLLPRAKEVGVEVAVFGGGGQRRNPFTPELWEARPIAFRACSSPESAFGKLVYTALCELYDEDFDQFLETFVENAPDTNPTPEDFHQQMREAVRRWMSPLIAPEGLNRTETDLGTDTGSFANTLAYYGIPYTADAYHILKEWDFDGREGGLSAPSEQYWAAQLPFVPVHAHIADLPDRLAPKADDLMLSGFFRRMKELGYEVRVSLEVRTPFDDLVGAADRVRELIRNV
jgi:hypothetical protein